LKKLLSFVLFLLFRGTTESGALKANALPSGARRLAVRAVKAAWFSRLSERSGRALTGGAGGPGAGFGQEGQGAMNEWFAAMWSRVALIQDAFFQKLLTEKREH